MGFPGVWMTESEALAYRVVPKCACSTIGQAMFFTDHGTWFDGDIHDATSGIHKWALEPSQPRIEAQLRGGQAIVFTCVRNPFTRILSCFFDKICGIQRNGRRYRENLLPEALARYGVRPDDPFDQIAMFRRFLLFARDTIRFRKPMDPDIHWSSIASHAATLTANGGRYNAVLTTERLDLDLANLLEQVDTPHRVNVATMPRFNESDGHGPKRAHPVEAYFDDLAIHLMHDIYRRDFNLFHYDRNPGAGAPTKPVDLEELHAKLAT